MREIFDYVAKYCHNWSYDLKGLFFQHGIQKVLPESNLQPQGYLFSKWYEKGLARIKPTTSRVSFSNVSTITMQIMQAGRVFDLTGTNYIVGISLRQSTFSSSLYTTKNVRSTCHKAGFTSNLNDFTPKSNNFRPDSINPFRHPCLGMIKSLSCRAINPD